MNTTPEVRPPWQASRDFPQPAPLSAEVKVEVCVIGGGIAGLTTAYLLAQNGVSVAVLDAGDLGRGETGHTTAHLSNALDDRYAVLERIHGSDDARMAAESHTAAIDRIESIVKSEHIDCDFQRVDGYLFCDPGQSPDVLDQELAAARRAGLADVLRVERAPVLQFDTGPCLRFPNQGQFHPLKYLSGLAWAIQERGGRIHSQTRATAIEGRSPATVKTERGSVIATTAVVVATNSPMNDRLLIHTKQAPYHTYAIGAAIPANSVAHVLLWDTHDPYHYVRVHPGGASEGRDLLIVGGEDHKAGQASDQWERFERLIAWTRERFPMIQEIAYRWSGQVMETLDGLAFIGRNPNDEPNIYIATGDSGMGLTHGTIAGMLISDLISGRSNPWEKIYDPSRKPVRSAWTFAKENLNVAVQFLDWLTGSDVADRKDILPGKGAVIRSGLTKIAVHRDEQGALHECSAVCPHLGCIVAWNDVDKTWDCPCHGSRFHADGRVRNGPAAAPLEAIRK